MVVLGSGAAGLSAALAARPVRSALIVTKDTLDAGSTAWAQGGLAGVLDPQRLAREPRARHAGRRRRTVRRGDRAHAGGRGAEGDPLPDAAWARRSIRAHDGDGPALTREGGHSHNRIVHSGGDQSGAEVQRTLDETAVAAGVEVMDRAFALDLVIGSQRGRTPPGRRCAHRAHRRRRRRWCRSASSPRGPSCWPPAATARCSPPRRTRRRSPATGWRSRCAPGLPARDIEFVQFHPTVLWRGPDATGQQALDQRGGARRGCDPVRRRRRAGDGSACTRWRTSRPATWWPRRSAGGWPRRRPESTTTCTSTPRTWASASTRASRRSPRRAARPASTRRATASRSRRPRTTSCGGVRADLDGRTELDGSVRRRRGRVHRRARRQPPGDQQPHRGRRRRHPCRPRPGVGAARARRARRPAPTDRRPGGWSPAEQRVADPLDDVSPRRRAATARGPGRRRAGVGRRRRPDRRSDGRIARRWEATNLLTVAQAVVAAATARTESRGCHRRTDFTRAARRVAVPPRRPPRPQRVVGVGVSTGAPVDGRQLGQRG